MNVRLLQGNLPETIHVDGFDYPIYVDFRRWIELETIIFEEPGNFLQKVPDILTLCYKKLPQTLEAAIKGLIEFYKGPEQKQTGSGRTLRPGYSFTQDDALIYAAFYQQYGIDLTKVELHWWQFRALFNSLADDTKIMQVMGYRLINLASVKNPDEKRFYRQMKALYKLKDNRTDQEREADTCFALAGLF